MWQQWLNIVLGLWLILSANLNLSSSSMATNTIITGLIVATLAIWGGIEHRAYQATESRRFEWRA